jgi:Uma2 family endonuclease
MATTVYVNEELAIPLTIQSLADFRAWAHSPEFPERCRIDYLGDRIEVDMSPEDLFCHGTLKTTVVGALQRLIAAERLGALFSDCTRVTLPESDASVEPDIVFLARASLIAGRVRLVPKASGEAGRYVEIEGPPDLVVEIVSDSSEDKDQRRLPAAFARSGVPEFWLLDAREEMLFQIYELQGDHYTPALVDAEGFQVSRVFQRRFQIARLEDEVFLWSFELREWPLPAQDAGAPG